MPPWPSGPTRRLLLAAQAGDPVSLGMLLQRHRARLHARATAFVGVDAAEDAVHETFLVALRRIGDVRDPDAAGPWLLAVVTNVCRAHLRRPVHERTDPEVLDRAAVLDSATEALERAARRDWVWTALERLPAERERHGLESLAAALESDLRDGVTFHVLRMIPGAELTYLRGGAAQSAR